MVSAWPPVAGTISKIVFVLLVTVELPSDGVTDGGFVGMIVVVEVAIKGAALLSPGVCVSWSIPLLVGTSSKDVAADGNIIRLSG